jgi:hypothetical protein
MEDNGEKEINGAEIVANQEKALEVQSAQEKQKSTLQQTEKVASSAEKSIEQAAKLEGKKGSTSKNKVGNAALKKVKEAAKVLAKGEAEAKKPIATQAKDAEKETEAQLAGHNLLGQDQCFYLVAADADGTEVALTVAKQDKYKPKKSGIFAVYADRLRKGAEQQRWSYDAKTKTIHSHKFPSKMIYEDGNNHLFMYVDGKPKNKRWAIDLDEGLVLNDLTNHTLSLGKKSLMGEDKQTVWHLDALKQLAEPDPLQKWNVRKCAEDLAEPTQEEADEEAANSAEVENDEIEKIADEQGQSENSKAGIETKSTVEKASKSAKRAEALKTAALGEATKALREDKGLSEESGEVDDETTETERSAENKELQDGVDEEKAILTSTMDVMNKQPKPQVKFQSLAALPPSGEISADFFDQY